MLHCNDIDGLMVDWLYGELDDARATEVSGHVEACGRCQAEQAAFSRTRELFSALPEAEPPSALTAMLVREAALSAKPAAPAKTEVKGGGFAEWLSRFLSPLMHPAAAAVATLVVVVGVAGVLYVKKGTDQFAEQRSGSTVSLESTSAERGDDRGVDHDKRPEKLAVADSENEVGAADPGFAQPAAPEEDDAKRFADIASPKQDANLRRAQQKKAKPARIATTGKGKRAASSPSKAEPPPFALSTEKDTKESDDDFAGDSPNDESLAYRGQKANGWAASLEGELVRAFKAEDCTKAARIANDIRDRDPSYYKANTAELDAVKRCGFYVNKERNRRRSVARKRAAQQSKAKKKSNSKSNAKGDAPKNAAPDEAFDAAESTE